MQSSLHFELNHHNNIMHDMDDVTSSLLVPIITTFDDDPDQHISIATQRYIVVLYDLYEKCNRSLFQFSIVNKCNVGFFQQQSHENQLFLVNLTIKFL